MDIACMYTTKSGAKRMLVSHFSTGKQICSKKNGYLHEKVIILSSWYWLYLNFLESICFNEIVWEKNVGETNRRESVSIWVINFCLLIQIPYCNCYDFLQVGCRRRQRPRSQTMPKTEAATTKHQVSWTCMYLNESDSIQSSTVIKVLIVMQFVVQ